MVLLWASAVWAQTCSCETELDFVLKKLRRTPSYREQIRGKARTTFHNEIEQIRSEMEADPLLRLHCRAYLQRTVALVRDRHLAIHRASQPPTGQPNRPAVDNTLDLDALEAGLREAAPGALPGIYAAGETQLAVFAPPEGGLLGVMLSTPAEGWSRGDIVISLTEKPTHTEALVYGSAGAVYLRAASADRLLSRLPYQKEGRTTPHRGPGGEAAFTALGDGVGYLWLPTFSGMMDNLTPIRALYAEVSPQLADLRALIVDVRDNSGGGQVAYEPLMEALDGAGPIQLHVIVNRSTASAAEHFALRMQRRHGAILYGENTVGAIRYRYWNRARESPETPCYGYPISLTVARVWGPTADPALEYVGITPDVPLSSEADWLAAVEAAARLGG